jgi:hypothetical protein
VNEPLLIVLDSDTSNRFAAYILEILAVEGCKWIAIHDLAQAPLDLAAPRGVLGAHGASRWS